MTMRGSGKRKIIKGKKESRKLSEKHEKGLQ
jgi:hypothetical protein